MTAHTPPASARDHGKAQSRARLIEAAATAIYRHGLRGATIGEIQAISGLSRGMINLHFKTKENLLLAVAQDLSAHYSKRWNEVARNPDLSAKQKLEGIIKVDLAPDIMNARDVAIWFAFRSEVYSNPEYRQYIDSRDSSFRDTMVDICNSLIGEGNYDDADASLATNCLIALLEGMWTDFHLHSDEFNRGKAEQACLYAAKRFFPDHF